MRPPSAAEGKAPRAAAARAGVNGGAAAAEVAATPEDLAEPSCDAADASASAAELEYTHELKPGKPTDIPELEAQIERQVNRMNSIVEGGA